MARNAPAFISFLNKLFLKTVLNKKKVTNDKKDPKTTEQMFYK